MVGWAQGSWARTHRLELLSSLGVVGRQRHRHGDRRHVRVLEAELAVVQRWRLGLSAEDSKACEPALAQTDGLRQGQPGLPGHPTTAADLIAACSPSRQARDQAPRRAGAAQRTSSCGGVSPSSRATKMAAPRSSRLRRHLAHVRCKLARARCEASGGITACAACMQCIARAACLRFVK